MVAPGPRCDFTSALRAVGWKSGQPRKDRPPLPTVLAGALSLYTLTLLDFPAICWGAPPTCAAARAARGWSDLCIPAASVDRQAAAGEGSADRAGPLTSPSLAHLSIRSPTRSPPSARKPFPQGARGTSGRQLRPFSNCARRRFFLSITVAPRTAAHRVAQHTTRSALDLPERDPHCWLSRSARTSASTVTLNPRVLLDRCQIIVAHSPAMRISLPHGLACAFADRATRRACRLPGHRSAVSWARPHPRTPWPTPSSTRCPCRLHKAQSQVPPHFGPLPELGRLPSSST